MAASPAGRLVKARLPLKLLLLLPDSQWRNVRQLASNIETTGLRNQEAGGRLANTTVQSSPTTVCLLAWYETETSQI
jgi:hypothetical protein